MTSDESSRLVLFSADCHAGPELDALGPYVDPRHAGDFADYLALTRAYDAEIAEMFAGRREAAYEEIHRVFIERDTVPGLADPAEHLRDLEADGVVGDVIFPQGVVPFADYPSQPGMLPPIGYVATPELHAAGCRAYNRWLAEFCSHNPGRHAGVGVMPIRDVDAATREIEWCHGAGLRGMSLPPVSEAHPYFNDPRYEPIWATCARLDLPLSAHGASTRFYGHGPDSLPIALAEVDFFGRRALWFLIFSGVFERHPGLRMVFTEQRAGWVSPTLAYLDDIYRSSVAGIARALPRSPSDYFATNCFIGASFLSATEAEARHRIGVTKLMWGSDYPHPEGAWPWSRESLRRTCADMTDAEMRLVLGANAMTCYGMDAAVLARAAAAVGPTLAELREAPGEVPPGAHLSWAFRSTDMWT
ncbi:MAG: amidohydrolase [Actinobacteria bacterium]|nr:amidohydrolase [Actinomycetota bacterium]